MSDSKLWEEAFSAYRSKYPQLSKKAQRKKNRRIKNGRIANIKFNQNKNSQSITETTKEFYRWKNTDGYEKWRKSRFLKQGGLCFYCEDWMPLTRINVEHIVPRSRGGSNKPENLVLSCSPCNKDKGSRMLTEEQIFELKSRSKKHRGTYLKNKEYYDNLYGDYLDDGFKEMLKIL